MYKCDHCPKYVGGEIHRLNKSLFRSVECTAKKHGLEDLDYMHNWILRFLHQNSDRDIYQKDLEAVLTIGKSTVTNLVKQMEQKGLIRREEVKSDARLKRLCITEDGVKKHLETISMFDEIEEGIRAGISEEELEIFFSVVEKMQKNTEHMTGGKTC